MKNESIAFSWCKFLIILPALATVGGMKYEAERGHSEITLNTGLLPGVYLPGVYSGSQLITKELIIK